MKYIVRGGVTQYSIRIGENASEKEKFAAGELAMFLGEASSASVPVCSGTEEPAFILSAGTGDDGYDIVTDGDNYHIKGHSGRGLIYGVYELCRFLTGLEIFSADVWRQNTGDIVFREINVSDKPDIPARAAGIYPYHSEKTDEPFLPKIWRMRLRGMAEGWGICNHSYFKILPPSVYAAEHPDWYSAGDGGKNLCLTNEGMRAEFVRRVKQIVCDHPDAEYFMLGQEDSNSFCSCPVCTSQAEKYGGRKSAVMLLFSDSVVREVNEWMEKEFPGRRAVFCMFAYQQTIVPPDMLPDKFRPQPNLAVMLAPLSACGNRSYFDPDNRMSLGTRYSDPQALPVRDLIYGWRKIVDKIFFWSYNVDYSDILLPFNCFDALKDNYAGYKELGAEYVFEEGAYSRYVPNFSALRAYLVSRLMWDCSADPEELTDRFMNGFYGPAAAAMRELFDLLRDAARRIAKDCGRPMLYIRFDDYPDMNSPEYWDFELLEKAARCHLRATQKAFGEYLQRVEDEGVPVYCLMLRLYGDRLDEKEKARMRRIVCSAAERYGLFSGGEGINVNFLNRICGREPYEG